MLSLTHPAIIQRPVTLGENGENLTGYSSVRMSSLLV